MVNKRKNLLLVHHKLETLHSLFEIIVIGESKKTLIMIVWLLIDHLVKVKVKIKNNIII